MTGRTAQILGRFPAHMEAARPGKLLGDTVDALALDLDTLAAALAAVRRAHRLADADELADLWRIAALHGMAAAEFEIVLGRFRRARELLATLEHATDDGGRNAAADALAALWAVDLPPPHLARFAEPLFPADTARAAARMTNQVRETLRAARLTDAVRERIATVCRIHATGNGTVMALLRGAANALDLELGEVVDSDDRYWHVARVRDRMRLAHLEPGTGGMPVATPLPVAGELLGIEENPLWRAETDNASRVHGELFTELRRGFERSLLQVRITGEGVRTIGPMLVNRDEGIGIGFSGSVPDGKTLVFDEEGRALLDGTDVTALAFAWQGACFAGDDASANTDFLFADQLPEPPPRQARFAIATAPGALDREALFPSAGDSLPMPGVEVGVTRLAFFVREAHFASLDPAPPASRGVTPRTGAAVFDEAVLAPAPFPRTPSARVALSWLEHRAFAVRLLVPARFRAWRSEDEGALTLQAVARSVERFRPLGVELRVEFIDDRWRLGSGTLTSGIDDDPIESLRAGTSLWPAAPEPVT